MYFYILWLIIFHQTLLSTSLMAQYLIDLQNHTILNLHNKYQFLFKEYCVKQFQFILR